MQFMQAGFICHVSAGQRADYEDNVAVSYSSSYKLTDMVSRGWFFPSSSISLEQNIFVKMNKCNNILIKIDTSAK